MLNKYLVSVGTHVLQRITARSLATLLLAFIILQKKKKNSCIDCYDYFAKEIHFQKKMECIIFMKIVVY